MLVAVPLFGRDVAPRFRFADRFLIADISNGEFSSELYAVMRGGWPGRLMELKRLGVRTVLCSGFNRRFVPLAASMGINVISGLGGDARAQIEAFARDVPPAEVTAKSSTSVDEARPSRGRPIGKEV